MSTRPATPPDVSRYLRQEAGFGCCKCGHAILEYHHIVPWSTEHHFRTADMMALCPNHHQQAGAGGMSEQEQRSYKAAPYNIGQGKANGQLVLPAGQDKMLVGGLALGPSGPLLVVDDYILVQARADGNSLLVSLVVLDENDQILLRITDNEWVTGDAELYDLESRWRRLVVRRRLGDVLLDVDGRTYPYRIKGQLQKSGRVARLRHSGMQLEANPSWRPTLRSVPERAVGVELRSDGGLQLFDEDDFVLFSHEMRPVEMPLNRLVAWHKYLGTVDAAESIVKARLLQLESEIDDVDIEWRPLVLLNLGVMYRDRGDSVVAQLHLRNAESLGGQEDASRAGYLLGGLLERLEQPQAARDAYLRAVQKGHFKWSALASVELARIALAEGGDAAHEMQFASASDSLSARRLAKRLLAKECIGPNGER